MTEFRGQRTIAGALLFVPHPPVMTFAAVLDHASDAGWSSADTPS